MTKQKQYYEKEHIEFLEKLWGDGYMSPGGTEEVKKILDGLKISKKSILDLGCGSGGITVSLVTNYGAKNVIGLDIENDVCLAAKQRVIRLGLEQDIKIKKANPGPLEFEDMTFDIVFSKDSIVHIQDKERLVADIFRILKPGGYFVASDWLRSHDGQPSAEMMRYLDLEDLGFDMASPKRYRVALERAGYENIVLLNRNEWYLDQARKELNTLSKLRRKEFELISSKEYMDLSIETWNAMITVLETGEHCPHHIRARRPI